MLEKRFDRTGTLPASYELPLPPLGFRMATREEAEKNWKTALKYNLPDGNTYFMRRMGAWVVMTHYGYGDLFCVPI